MGSAAAVQKTEEELRKELDQLNRQHREINERLRNPRGIRRGGLSGGGPRNFAANGGRGRGFVRPAERTEPEDQPPAKRRLSSTIVKAEDGEIIEDEADARNKESTVEVAAKPDDRKQSNWSRRVGNQRPSRMDFELPQLEHAPRVLPKNEEPSLVNRNKRMFGLLLGTLEKFRKEDQQLAGTEAYMRRHNSLQLAEQRAREESEKLRQQEREQIAVKRKRDLTLRARVAAKAEEKRMELSFLQWSEHQRKLGNFLRTKAEPPIFYMFAKPMDEDTKLVEQRKEETFEAWKAARREELTQYQKQVEEQYMANVEKDMEKWQNARKARKTNNDMLNLQETMDKELETHRLEHGPKTRKIPSGANNEDEDDVEDINAGEDDMLDDVLGVDEKVKVEAGNGSPHADNGISNV